MRRGLRFAGVTVLLLAAGCTVVPKSAPPSPPISARPSAPIPVTVSPPAPVLVAGWEDRPIIEGDWSYDPAARLARFTNDRGEEVMSLACIAAPRAVRMLVRYDGAANQVLTTAGANAIDHRLAGASVPVDDILLDRIAFSRGRFAVRGTILQVLPVQAEIGRLIEDCRGG